MHTGFFSGGGGGGGGGRGGGDLTEDLRMYMRRCHAYNILVNKSHNNAVITNDFLFACVCHHIICAVYIRCILLWNSGGGGGGGRSAPPRPPPPPPLCMQPCFVPLSSPPPPPGLLRLKPAGR